MKLNNKIVLITGGTGSFGKKFTEIVLEKYKLKKLIIFSRDEQKQYEMEREFNNKTIRYFIGDVRDKERLYRAFSNVDIVIHAAALKHVHLGEYNPFEVVKTNILGAQNIINVAIDQGVKKVIAISTDKATNPINLYGATKLCSDKLFIAGNSYAGKAKTIFSVVRYGNVINSTGSVIPLFEKLKKTGTIPITDKNMTRFWITLEQGVDFVLKCLGLMKGGEILVPKLPSMSIMDLAKAIAPECKYEFTGIRPGEKIHEVLIPKDEARNTLEFPDYFLIKPSFTMFGKRNYGNEKGKLIDHSFEYRSDNNDWRVTPQELLNMIK
ncbi:MAG: UDP-N-acetylglucosamine 4,6-dehydratase (inverting) [bacterium]|nr:UDP-N-acetylglucosamine 4,6-dehydratase (inverting) [bacterium]